MPVPRATRQARPAARTARVSRRHPGYLALPLGAALTTAALLVVGSGADAAQGPVGLGTAASFAVLAGAGISNTGPTVIDGDTGSFPTPTETGFNTVVQTGTNHGGDAVTQQAKTDLGTAYTDAAGRLPVSTVPVELGGTTLIPGVYQSAAGTFGLTGTVTLNAQGNPAAEFVFQAASTLITASNSSVRLVNGASPCNVVWQVGSSATFGTGTQFAGDVLAYTSITADTGASFQGRLLAENGAVTLDTNTVDNASCTSPPVTTSTTSTSTSTTSTSTSTTSTSTTSTTLPAAVKTTGGSGTAPTVPTGSARPTTPASSAGPAGATPLVGGGTGTAGSKGAASSSAGFNSGDTPAGQLTGLPFTGAPVRPLAETALALLAAGAVAMRAGRRRRVS